MSAPAPPLRYERKLIPLGLTLPEVLALVRLHPALFREVYPPRAVNNVYLDWPDRRHYHDHLNGVGDRLKVRIRWYGPLNGVAERPVLERKIKHGLVSHKLAHPLAPLTVPEAIERGALATVLDQPGLPEASRSALRWLEPSLANRYQRQYFQSADGRFRLTVDSNLQFFRPSNGTPILTPLSHGEPAIILELKYPEPLAAAAAQITNAWPFRVTRCSKYVLGIEKLLMS